MKRIAISDAQPESSLLWEYYQTQKQAVSLLRSNILNQPSSVPASLAARFFLLTDGKVNDYFANLSIEIDHQVCLNLIASAEAAIMVDFLNRVYDRTRSVVTRQFRELARRAEEENRRVRLDEILEIWLGHEGSPRKLIEDFRAALNYRHWLAHGRYWNPKLGRDYDPMLIQDITVRLRSALGIR